MVNILSAKEAELVAKATALAEQSTSAEIATVIIPKSDYYLAEMMFFGFILGSIIDFIVWEMHMITRFPQLFAIQIVCVFLLPFIPGVKHAIFSLLPKKLLNHRAAHIGAEEILAITSKLPPRTPVVLLFVSLAEHYVHLFPNPVVKNKIDDVHWDKVINGFTSRLKKKNLTKACTETIKEIGTLLAPVFPDNGEKNRYEDAACHVTKKKKG